MSKIYHVFCYVVFSMMVILLTCCASPAGNSGDNGNNKESGDDPSVTPTYEWRQTEDIVMCQISKDGCYLFTSGFLPDGKQIKKGDIIRLYIKGTPNMDMRKLEAFHVDAGDGSADAPNEWKFLSSIPYKQIASTISKDTAVEYIVDIAATENSRKAVPSCNLIGIQVAAVKKDTADRIIVCDLGN